MKDWKQLTAADVMSSPVVTVRPDCSLGDALKTFVDEDISGTVVVSELGKPMGVIGLFDMVQHLAGFERPLILPGSFYAHRFPGVDDTGQRWERNVSMRDDDLFESTTVRDMMTPEIISVAADSPLSQVAREMARRKIHRMVVVGEKNQLLGIITTLDVVAAVGGVKPAARELAIP